MLQFEIDKLVEMTDLNTKPERHGDEWEPAADIFVKGSFKAEEITPLFGYATFSMASFKKAMWDKEGGPLAKHKLLLSTVFTGCEVIGRNSADTEDLFQSGLATISAFELTFDYSHRCDLKFKIRGCFEGADIARVYASPRQEISLVIRGGNIVVSRKTEQTDLDMEGDDNGLGLDDD